jgi:hypothetical protein
MGIDRTNVTISFRLPSAQDRHDIGDSDGATSPWWAQEDARARNAGVSR